MTMRAGCAFVGILGGVLVAFTINGTAQVDLPEGPNRDLVEQKCGSCHSIEMVAINGRSADRWPATIDEMTGYGLQLPPPPQFSGGGLSSSRIARRRPTSQRPDQNCLAASRCHLAANGGANEPPTG